jgi:hypothetical protein
MLRLFIAHVHSDVMFRKDADCLTLAGTLVNGLVRASIFKFLSLRACCLLAGRYNEPPDNATGDLVSVSGITCTACRLSTATSRRQCTLRRK